MPRLPAAATVQPLTATTCRPWQTVARCRRHVAKRPGAAAILAMAVRECASPPRRTVTLPRYCRPFLSLWPPPLEPHFVVGCCARGHAATSHHGASRDYHRVHAGLPVLPHHSITADELLGSLAVSLYNSADTPIGCRTFRCSCS
jgi:hypothetical protein